MSGDCEQVIELGAGIEGCMLPADGHTEHEVMVWGTAGVSRIRWTLLPPGEVVDRLRAFVAETPDGAQGVIGEGFTITRVERHMPGCTVEHDPASSACPPYGQRGRS